MSDFLHRTQDTFVRSGNDPDFPIADWIVNPIINAVQFRNAGVPIQYTIRNASPDDTVTEMTQPQKDVVDAAIEAAALASERDNEKVKVTAKMALRALAEIIMDEINILRSKGYGGLFRSTAVTSQSIPNNSFTKLNALVGSTVMQVGGGVNADTVAGEIVLPKAGDWLISWNLSFSGDNNVEFIGSVFGNGNEAGARASRALGTGSASDVGNMSGHQIVNAPVANISVDLRVFHSEGTAKAITIEEFALSVEEMKDLNPRTLSQLHTQMENKIDTLDSLPGGAGF